MVNVQSYEKRQTRIASSTGGIEMHSQSTHGFPQYKILVVNTDRYGFRAIHDALAGNGFTVCSTASLAAAAQSIRDSPPNAILINFQAYDLAELNAYCALTRVRPELPLIVVGPKIDGRDKARMLEAGIADYIEFPFDLDELVARIRSSIRASRQKSTTSTIS